MSSSSELTNKDSSLSQGDPKYAESNKLKTVELNSLNLSVSSLNSSREGSPLREPLAYDNDLHGVNSKIRRRSSVGNKSDRGRSHSLVSSLADHLSGRGHSMSRHSVDSQQSLSRYSTSYSVKEIYGDMPEEKIMLQRSATKSTILNTLSKRVENANIEAERGENFDKESKVDERISEEDRLYQEVPDIPVPTTKFGGEFSSIDPELVTWDGRDDPEYPRNWSLGSKILQTAIVSIYTLIPPMSSSVCSPAMPDIAESLGMNSQFLQSFSVSIMVLAWALGPIIIAPLSESDKIGRRWVLNISVWISFIFNLACAFSKNTAQLCIFRFLGGLGGAAPLNVGAGTIADLWDDRGRQFAMAAYSISPSLGPVISPIMSGFIVENTHWKWVFLVLAILNAVVAFVGTLLFKETYSPKLLSLKAKRLRKETGNVHLHTIFEIANGETTSEKVFNTVTRPLQLLISHPMCFGLGSFMAFIYGFMYLMVVTFPGVFQRNYGFSVGISGLMFVPMGIGYVVGIGFWTWLIDYFYIKLTERNNGVSKPEYRLPCLCFAGIGIPVGLVWYGWSAQKEIHWIMPAIGSCIFAFAYIPVFQTIQNYLIDMNTRLSASSIASCSIYRSIFGFALPLAADPMYKKLNYGWGNTMCAFIAFALGIPFPIFCLMYGERLRDWANRRLDKKQAARDARNLKRLQQQNEKELAKMDKSQPVMDSSFLKTD